MSLHWIFGGSGFGKSHYAYNKIMQQAAADKMGKYIIIVPEQFTMQTQKDMVMMSENKGIMNIDVLSFVRLAYRVFEETDVLSKPLLEDEGKSMVIKRILREHASEWKTFGSNINRMGFVEEIKSIITEFVQYRVDDEKIDAMKEGTQGRKILSAKLEDLKLVYAYYRQYMEDRYISSEELLSILADYVPETAMLKDSVLCIDGFTGFTPVQYELLAELMKVCKDIYITVTISEDTDPFGKVRQDELFCMSKKYIAKCNEIALKCGVDIDTVWTGRCAMTTHDETDESMPTARANTTSTGWRFINNPELALLEKSIFRNEASAGADTFEKNEKIRVYEATDVTKEVEYCVWQINNLIRENGLRYRDIAVITADVETYARLFKTEFEKVGIPVFADNNRNILDNTFVSLLLAILALVKNDYDYQSVMTLLRNGIVRDYLGFENMETDALDTYLYGCGIRGRSMWNKMWNCNKKIQADIQIVNDTRTRVIEVFGAVTDKLKNAETVLDYWRILYDFMTEWNMSGIIKSEAERYETEGNPVVKKEYDQIYRIVINLIDQMIELMGDEKLDLREFTELVKLGFTEASVGVIPPGVDNIIVGDITRTRLKDIKVLFFVGVNEGSVPKTIKSGGFLSDMERELLAEGGAELAPTLRERIFNERFYIYLALTRPSDKLFISYCKKGAGAGELQPSSIIADIKELYGEDFVTDSGYGAWSLDAHLANDKGKTWWIEGLRKYAGTDKEEIDEDWLNLHNEKIKTEKNKDMLDSAFYKGEITPLTKDIAKKLYGEDISGSASRLELYASCAYAHFLRYGLKLEARKEYALEVPDMGTIFHKVIEEFSIRLEQKGKDWQDVTEEEITTWTGQIAEHACSEFGHGILNSDARNAYIKKRITRIAAATIENLSEQMKHGKFKAESYEVRFSSADEDTFTYDIDENAVLKLTGRMDRLDVYEDDEKVLYKVIDYKSGKPSFSLQKLYYGLNMQLVVYLMAAEGIEKKMHPDKLVIPAGTFYYYIDDPIVDEEMTDDETKIAAKLRKKHRMEGVANKDKHIPCYIDHNLGDVENGLTAGADSDVISAKVTSTGAFGANSSLYKTEQFDYMMAHTDDKIKEFGEGIINGNIAMEPYKLEKDTPCGYCEYKSICRFDARLSGNAYNKLENKEEIEIWDEWREKYGKEDRVSAGTEEGNQSEE